MLLLGLKSAESAEASLLSVDLWPQCTLFWRVHGLTCHSQVLLNHFVNHSPH